MKLSAIALFSLLSCGPVCAQQYSQRPDFPNPFGYDQQDQSDEFRRRPRGNEQRPIQVPPRPNVSMNVLMRAMEEATKQNVSEKCRTALGQAFKWLRLTHTACGQFSPMCELSASLESTVSDSLDRECASAPAQGAAPSAEVPKETPKQ